MRNLKIISFNEKARLQNNVYVEAVFQDETNPSLIYSLNEGKVVFESGKFREIELIKLNDNSFKNNFDKYSSVAVDIEKAVANFYKDLEEEITQKFRSLMNDVANLCLISDGKLTFQNTVTVGDFTDFFNKFTKDLDDHELSESSSNSKLNKSFSSMLKTNKSYRIIINIRDQMSKIQIAVDEKLTELVLRKFESKTFKNIMKLKINQFLSDNINDGLLDCLEVDSLITNESFIPVSYLLKKDPKMVLELLRAQVMRISLVVNSDINCDLNYEPDVGGKVYLNKKADSNLIKKFGHSFSEELCGLNFKIGSGTFDIQSLVPSKYVEFRNITEKSIIRCLDGNINSKKLGIQNCFTSYDLDIFNFVGMPKEIKNELQKTISSEEFKRKILKVS